MTHNYYDYMLVLQTLCCYRDWGMYDAVTRGITVLGNDIYELYELGIDNAAPITGRDEIPMGGDEELVTAEDMAQGDENGEEYECDHYHILYSFASPELHEYYRLCRLYECREGVAPKDDPYVMDADNNYVHVLSMAGGQFCAGFDSDEHTTTLIVEICPEWQYDVMEIIWAVRKTLGFYVEHLPALRREMARTPFVFLPALPAWTEQAEQAEWRAAA